MDFLSGFRESLQQITVVALIIVIGALAVIIWSLVADNAERVEEISKRVDEYDRRLNKLDSTIALRIAEAVEGELTDIKNGALEKVVKRAVGRVLLPSANVMPRLCDDCEVNLHAALRKRSA